VAHHGGAAARNGGGQGGESGPAFSDLWYMPRDGYAYYKVSERKGVAGEEEEGRRRRLTFIFNLHFVYNICLGGRGRLTWS